MAGNDDSGRYKTLSPGWLAAMEPPDEAERLAALLSLDILDSPASTNFDNITSLLAQRLGTAFALVSLVDSNRQWFKSSCGIDVTETSRDMAFCAHVIWDDAPLIVLDTQGDERFYANPLVVGEPHIRFYAGVPLITAEGYRLGTLCAIDTKPRKEFADKDIEFMQSLAQEVMDIFMRDCPKGGAGIEAVDSPPDMASPQGASDKPPYHKAHVLIAEDNDINQLVLSKMLKNMGCTYDIAADGIIALEMAAHTDYDAIFMDCHMPNMDGYEATRLLRQRDAGKRHVIIALTAGVMEENKKKCLECGMDDFLSKPVTQKELSGTLSKWL